MKVAVAVITDCNNRILITRRPHTADHGGMWEFPGGKLEDLESADSALIREIKEEVNLDVIEYKFLDEISYAYADYDVTLIVYHVNSYEGVAKACENQLDLRWVGLDEVKRLQFPEANKAIVELINKL